MRAVVRGWCEAPRVQSLTALHAQVRRKVVVMRNDGNDAARLVGRLIAWLVLTAAVLLPAAVVAVLVRAVLWGFGIG